MGQPQEDNEEDYLARIKRLEDNSDVSEIICAGTQLSAPDTQNQRQYISTVTSQVPDIDPPGCSTDKLIEVWGDGFYEKTNCTDLTAWRINK